MQQWEKRIEVWGELMYAVDELDRRGSDISKRLNKAADKDSPPFQEVLNRFLQAGMFEHAYFKAKMRADSKNAHEAIEKGLKAVLLDAGVSAGKVRSHGHGLHSLLADVQQHNREVYEGLERAFDYALRRVEVATGRRPCINMVDYFREIGTKDVFLAKRYESLEGEAGVGGGAIVTVNREVIRALASLVIGKTPKYLLV